MAGAASLDGDGSALPEAGGDYDAFISYKSQNVALARQVADRLIASGRRVWFAEYEVLLHNRERFEQEIDRGIARSRYGIAITNDLYACSKACRKEIAQLLARCGAARVIEIRWPPQPATRCLFPALEDAPALDSTGDPEAALEFISRVTGWPIVAGVHLVRPVTPQFHRGRCLGIGYAVDVAGWTLVRRSFHGGGPCYRLRDSPLYWNLQYGAADDLAALQARRRWGRFEADDRQLFDDTCRYARRYFSEVNSANAAGVHMLLAGGMGQFAVTYSRDRFLKRRYSVMLTAPGTETSAEFVFTFEFDGDVAEYCRHCALMDDLVASLRWDPALPRGRKPVPAMGDVAQEALAGSAPALSWVRRLCLHTYLGATLGVFAAYYHVPDWPRALGIGVLAGIVAFALARRLLPSPFL